MHMSTPGPFCPGDMETWALTTVPATCVLRPLALSISCGRCPWAWSSLGQVGVSKMVAALQHAWVGDLGS